MGRDGLARWIGRGIAAATGALVVVAATPRAAHTPTRRGAAEAIDGQARASGTQGIERQETDRNRDERR